MEDYKLLGTPIACGIKLPMHDEGLLMVDSTLYKSLIGSLRYLTCRRLNILYGIGLESYYMQEPKSIHWKAATAILSHIHGSVKCGLFYPSPNNFHFVGYLDSDLEGDLDDRKGTIQHFVFM